METEKSEKTKKIITIILILLVIASISVVLYRKFSKETPKENTEEQKLDISKINIDTELPGESIKPEKLEELEKTSEETPLEISTYKYKYDNEVFYLIDKLNKKKEYTNVKNVYYTKRESCNFYIKYFIVTEDKVTVVVLDDLNNNFPVDEIGAYKNNSYDSIDFIYVHSKTCGALLNYFGHTQDDKYYDLETGLVIDLETKYNYYDIIKSNRTLKYLGLELTVKVVMKSTIDKRITYIIDNNNYLYQFKLKDAAETIESYEVTKVSDKKVKMVYYKEYQNEYTNETNLTPIKVIYEDGSEYQEDNFPSIVIEY